VDLKDLPNSLTPVTLQLSQLLLDPNNPRFSELGEDPSPVPESRFAEPRVQSVAYEKMKRPSFDVAELRDTIKTLGFLPVDRLVVRRWKPSEDKYVVVEGNRRVTALRWLHDLHDEGKLALSAEQEANYSTLGCLLLDDTALPAAHLIIPGLRHVSGIKEWGPYQKAKAVHSLRTMGYSSQEVGQTLGLSTRAANQAYRCFKALEQMKGDEELGEYAEPRMYSYFEEVMKRPNLREWLAWDDTLERFGEEARIREFYSWIVPLDGGASAKLPEALSVRELGQIVDDAEALAVLRRPEGSLSKALARFEADHPEEWQPKIHSAISALKLLSTDELRTLDPSSLKLLKDLQERAEQVIVDHTALMQSRHG
jgi:hypothetical protein